MSEKLDLFELTVKRGLEHYELPMESNAWDNFKGHLGNGAGTASAAPSGGSFLGNFGVAAAVLTAVGLFINYSTADLDATASNHMSHDAHAEVADHKNAGSTEAIVSDTNEDSETFNLAEPNASTLKINDAADNVVQESSQSSTAIPAGAEVTASESKIMNSINDKLQTAADHSVTQEQGEDLEVKTVTRYVGAAFNLGASAAFSPNADGKNDTFLPSALKKGDTFQMTISTTAGKVIYTSNDVMKPWNGADSTGQTMRAGQYAWEVTTSKDNNKEIFRGIVRLEK